MQKAYKALLLILITLSSAFIVLANIFWLLRQSADTKTFLWINITAALIFLLTAVSAFAQKNK